MSTQENLSPEEKFIHKLWSNKISRRIMIALIIVQAGLVFISGGKEVVNIVASTYKLLVNQEPTKNESKNIRHSFLIGYYSIELFNHMKSGQTKEWPQVFNSYKRRIEASLIAINYKELKILEPLNPSNAVEFFDQMDRFRILSEGYIDSLGENELRSYLVGVNFSIILRELSQDKPSELTLKRYRKILKSEISSMDKNSKYDFSDILSKEDEANQSNNDMLISILDDFDVYRSKVGADKM